MLEEKIKAILAFQATGSDRIDKWKYEAQYGELLNIAEDIPEYRDWKRAFRILCQLIFVRDLRHHPSAHRSESPVETMSYSSSGLALSIS